VIMGGRAKFKIKNSKLKKAEFKKREAQERG
jgi:hypothetical protein